MSKAKGKGAEMSGADVGTPAGRKGCSHKTKHGPNAGKPCGRPPIRGGTVCPAHGNNKATRDAANRRLLQELVGPALAELRTVLTAPSTSDADKIRAAVAILDRTGFGPSARVEVGVSRFDELLEQIATEAIIEDDRPPIRAVSRRTDKPARPAPDRRQPDPAPNNEVRGDDTPPRRTREQLAAEDSGPGWA
jgi:hypothetical protein